MVRRENAGPGSIAGFMIDDCMVFAAHEPSTAKISVADVGIREIRKIHAAIGKIGILQIAAIQDRHIHMRAAKYGTLAIGVG